MDDVGWSILLLCLLTPTSLFFTLNSLALRSFSRVKLQEAFKEAGRENRIDTLIAESEKLAITCGSLRVFCNAAIIFILALMLTEHHYIIAFASGIIILELLLKCIQQFFYL